MCLREVNLPQSTLGIFLNSIVTFSLSDRARLPTERGVLLPASTAAVGTLRTVSLTDDALVFHSQERGHKPQVRAVDVVSWAMVRVD